MKKLFSMLVVLAAVTAAGAWVVEDDHFASTEGDWQVAWNPGMNWDMVDDPVDGGGDGGVWGWYFWDLGIRHDLMPGIGQSIEPEKWYIRPTTPYVRGSTNRYDYAPRPDAAKWGMELIDPSRSGEAEDVAKIAAYITPGNLLVQQNWGGDAYSAEVPYFRSQMRLAVVGADEDTIIQIRTYAYNSELGDWGWWDYGLPVMTLTSYENIAVGSLDDNAWMDYFFNLAKPTTGMGNGISDEDRTLFEIEILNGPADAKLYVDELQINSTFAGDETYAAPTWVIPEPTTMIVFGLGCLLIRRKN